MFLPQHQLGHPDQFMYSPYPQKIEQNQPILHAPIPLSAQISLLQQPLHTLHLGHLATCTPHPLPNQSIHYVSSESPIPSYSPAPDPTNGFELLASQPKYVVPTVTQPGRHTFPTPSELLTDMANSPDSLSSSSSSESWGSNSSTTKARRRVVAESIGFDSTDPDTITSHDKKRHYLECLESYICFLNSYFEARGLPVPPLSRFEHQKELDNRSIRTLLVHMTHKAEELCSSKEREEKRWFQLKDVVAHREAQFPCD